MLPSMVNTILQMIIPRSSWVRECHFHKFSVRLQLLREWELHEYSTSYTYNSPIHVVSETMKIRSWGSRGCSPCGSIFTFIVCCLINFSKMVHSFSHGISFFTIPKTYIEAMKDRYIQKLPYFYKMTWELIDLPPSNNVVDCR